MTKYQFGIMSNKWELEANNDNIAYISMIFFIKQDIPIAVYKPKKLMILPKEFMENQLKNNIKLDGNEITNTIKSIKEVKLC